MTSSGETCLRASSFESYMLADDTTHHPMTFQFRFVFRGEVDREALRTAIDNVTPLHPLLTARPVLRGGSWFWEPQTRSLALDCGPLGEPLTCPAGIAIDLRREAGMRFWCRTGDGRTELTLQGHHACTDGLGALQFFFDVLADYHRLFELPTTVDGTRKGARGWGRTIDGELLSGRDQHDFTPPEPVGVATQVRCLVGETAKLLLRQPQRLQGSRVSVERPSGDASQNLPYLNAIDLSSETSEAYRRSAAAQGVMANDLFLRDMFMTLVRWSEQCGRPLPDRRWLRLTMPINVRKRAHARMSAANMISYAFITRSVAATRDPAKLLASIHEETEAIKYWRLGSLFLGGVAAMQRARILRPVLRFPSCFSSLVLSNLGDIRHSATARFPRNEGRIVAGKLELQSVVAAPPPRSKTHGAIVVSRYAGCFSLGIQTDDTIDSDSAEAFLQLYASQIAASAV